MPNISIPKKVIRLFWVKANNFMFFSHPWLNMHHYLYNQALKYKDSGIDETLDKELLKQLNSREKEIVEASLQFYADLTIFKAIIRHID